MGVEERGEKAAMWSLGRAGARQMGKVAWGYGWYFFLFGIRAFAWEFLFLRVSLARFGSWEGGGEKKTVEDADADAEAEGFGESFVLFEF